MTFTCVIVDDEPIARRGLEKYISRTEELECIGVFGSAADLDGFLHREDQTTEPDIIFMDIKMPEMTGVDYLALNTLKSAVIIVTAYESYALRGFNLYVTDYLLKPVPYERFLKAVGKAQAYRRSLRKQHETTPALTDSIFVKSDRVMHRIILSDIIYIEGMENYAKIYSDKSMVVARTTLKGLMEKLPEENFVQTHRSFVINISHLKSIEGNQIRMSNGTVVPVSRGMRTRLQQLLNLSE